MNSPFTALAQNRQLRLVLIVFALLFALLAGGYYYFLRADYVVLYSGLRPADASAIVAELDSKGVAYKLRDKGTTILVSEEEADSVRLAVVRSDAPSKGTSGFELFNKSDMGLTDFAQKINYQRALQGEIARTIMMMEGVVDARVHLAMPDRSLFRGNRSEPKAAVAVTLQRGRAIDEARVAGIQRLVANAVPDLALTDVVVLDEVGRVISASAAAEAGLPPMMEEQAAVQQYYRARARAAVENTVPGLKFDVRVLVLSEGEGMAPGAAAAAAAPDAAQAGRKRDFRLRLSIVTPSEINGEDRGLIENAVAAAVGLDPRAGDALLFTVGPLDPVAAPTVGVAAAPTVASGPLPVPAAAASAQSAWPSSGQTLVAIAIGILLVLIGLRARAPALPAPEREAFVARIREQLALTDGTGDARA